MLQNGCILAYMRLILVGLSNPYSHNPSDALAPYPKGSSGRRLWKMMNKRTGITEFQYMRKFQRVNLRDFGDFPTDAERVKHLKRSFRPGDTVVLLGDELRKLMGLRKMLIHPQVVEGVTYRQIPHPSGRNLFYNDPICKSLVGMLLEDLAYGETRKTEEGSEVDRHSAEHPRRLH